MPAPVLLLCLPERLFEWEPRPVVDCRLDGARVYSDVARRPGAGLEVEIFLPQGETVVVQAEVAWIATLPPGSSATYDVGLHFTHVSHHDADRLRAVLDLSAD